MLGITGLFTYSLGTAAIAAEVLLKSDGVHEVQVFGSIARQGRGNDIDLIVVADDEKFKLFRTYLQDRGIDGQSYYWCSVRWGATAHALGLDPDIMSLYAKDVFVFPVGWQGRLDELQEMFRHEDPNFMKNISRDVRTFDAATRTFAPVDELE